MHVSTHLEIRVRSVQISSQHKGTTTDIPHTLGSDIKHNIYGMSVLAHQVEQVYYLFYSCEKLSVWWVVHKGNP
jgi:hypothetical protein